jgi:hypothetical protein
MQDPKISKVIQSEIVKIKHAIAQVEIKRDSILICFEIFGGGDETDKQTKLHHMHIQLVPIPVTLQDTIEDDFKNEAQRQGMVVLESLPIGKFEPFCRFEIVGKEPIVVSIPQSTNGIYVPFNIQIARYFCIH